MGPKIYAQMSSTWVLCGHKGQQTLFTRKPRSCCHPLFFYMKVNWTCKRKKRVAYQLTERSTRGGVSVEQAINKINHFQIHVLHFIIILYNYSFSSTSSNYSSCLLFTMSATCWSQTSLLLSQSQCNHQQLRKRKWLPSGQIRMCNRSYSNGGFLPEFLYQHAVIIPYAYFTWWSSIGAQFILSSVKLNRKSSMPHVIQIAKLMSGNVTGLFGNQSATAWRKKCRADTSWTTGRVLIKTSIQIKVDAFMWPQH